MKATQRMALGGVYLAAIGIALAGAEAYLRASADVEACLSAPPPPHERRPPARWARLDAELGWVGSADMEGVNPQGFRDSRNFSRLDVSDDARRVLVLGDSFIWGVGVGSDATVPRHLARTLGDGVAVFNLGVPGWGLDQMYLAYLRYRDVLRPDVVVLAYIDDDVSRMLTSFRVPEGFEKPVLHVRDDVLVRMVDPTAVGPVRRAIERSIVLRCSVREARRMLAVRPLASRVLAEIDAETSARGEELLVVRIADEAAATSPWGQRWWWARGFAHVLPKGTFVETLPDFTEASAAGARLYLDDGHLSETGTARLAALIASHLGPRLATDERDR